MRKPDIPRYYLTDEDLQEFIESIPVLCCPFCHSLGTFVLHGYLKGHGEDSLKDSLIRGRRIYCSERNRHNGCGHTLSILSAKYIRGFCITSVQVWTFLTGIYQSGKSKRAAFKALDLGMGESMPYHLMRRLRHAVSDMRTGLFRHGFAVDPPSTFADPLEAMVSHLRSLSRRICPAIFFQHRLQQSLI